MGRVGSMSAIAHEQRCAAWDEVERLCDGEWPRYPLLPILFSWPAARDAAARPMNVRKFPLSRT